MLVIIFPLPCCILVWFLDVKVLCGNLGFVLHMYISLSDIYIHTHNFITEDDGTDLSVKCQSINTALDLSNSVIYSLLYHISTLISLDYFK